MTLPISGGEASEVTMAFELVLQELDDVIESLNENGAVMFQSGDYSRVGELMESAKRVDYFKAKTQSLQSEWNREFPSSTPDQSEHQTEYSRMPKGRLTPQGEYRRPILESINELGGSATITEVLEKVGQKMGDKLNEYDWQPVKSNPSQPRWRNRAQWCRNTLANTDGFLSADSPYGVWEITDSGRQHLRQLQQDN